MRAEIIAVGTELLMGQIVNTNAQFLARALADLGVGVYYQTVVGDNVGRMKEALGLAAGRADLVICTGGLGPTQDDLTKDVLAETLGQPLVMHQPSMDRIAEFFERRGTPMVESNARQALMLERSEPLPNDNGMAVGVALTEAGTHYILLPGPPKEMKLMFERYAAPWIEAKLERKIPLHSVMLKFSGIGESLLEHKLLDLIEAQTDPTIAPYAKEGEVAVRVTTRATDALVAEAKLKPLLTEIASRLGEHLYAYEDITIEEQIIRLLAERGQKLAVAESCTGGLLSQLITSVPGSAAAFLGGIICYSNELKHGLLDVPMDVLEGEGAPGAVSEQTARLLADHTLSKTGADYSIAVTGVAGPATSEGKPVGLVYIGLGVRGREPEVLTLNLSGTRETVRLRAAKSGLYGLWKQLGGNAAMTAVY